MPRAVKDELNRTMWANFEGEMSSESRILVRESERRTGKPECLAEKIRLRLRGGDIEASRATTTNEEERGVFILFGKG